MVNTSIKFTYEDYKNLPDSETKRYELLEGELIMVPSPTTSHQRISMNLLYILKDFLRKKNLGFLYHAPCDVVLSPEDVLQPDIFFISKERSHTITEENIQGAPDLVIEILSPATAQRDRTIKQKIYGRYGIKEYWIVDAGNKTIEILLPGKKGFQAAEIFKDRLTSSMFPGLTIDLSGIFGR